MLTYVAISFCVHVNTLINITDLSLRLYHGKEIDSFGGGRELIMLWKKKYNNNNDSNDYRMGGTVTNLQT